LALQEERLLARCGVWVYPNATYESCEWSPLAWCISSSVALAAPAGRRGRSGCGAGRSWRQAQPVAVPVDGQRVGEAAGEVPGLVGQDEGEQVPATGPVRYQVR